jgi:hypothetical protein
VVVLIAKAFDAIDLRVLMSALDYYIIDPRAERDKVS